MNIYDNKFNVFYVIVVSALRLSPKACLPGFSKFSNTTAF